MMIRSIQRGFLPSFRSLAIAVIFFVLTHPVYGQEKIEKLADIAAHSDAFSFFGDFLDVLEVLTGGSSVKVQDLFEGERIYVNVGDLIQIPVRIEYQHENTWDGKDEWIFFEYSIVLDGAEVAWGRIPEQGYFKDQDVGRVLRKDLWIGLDRWECGRENKRTLAVYGNVYDDAPRAGMSDTYAGRNDRKDTHSSTRMHKAIWGNQSDRKFHDSRPLSEDSKSLDLIILNPFYGTKPTAIKNKMEHGEPMGALYLKRELHWKPFVQSGKGIFYPNVCDVHIEPLESLPPEWIWKMDLPNPSPLDRDSKITIRYDGHHIEPEHWGWLVSYWGLNSYVASGKFRTPPVSEEFEDLLTSHWDKQSWSTVFLYGGLTQSNKCFPAEYKAYCMHDQTTSPATASGDKAKSDPALAERYNGKPVITPSGDDHESGESKSKGGIKDPVDEWEKQGWTDPPGSWPDLKNPNRIKDALKDLDTKKYDGVQKSVVSPRFALESDLVTGTVILDSRETKGANVILFDVSPELVTGLVTLDGDSVIQTGSLTVSQSGKNAWLGWMAATGNRASSVELLSKGRQWIHADPVDVFPREIIPDPFPAHMQGEEAASHLNRIWADNTGDDPGEIPPVIQYAPEVIERGGTATFYGFFPNRKFGDETASAGKQHVLAGIGLGPVEGFNAESSEIVELLTLASSSIEYRALVPPDIPIERFRIYVILGNGEALPTDQTTTVVDFTTEGTAVLRTGGRGELTIRLDAPEITATESQSMYLSVENRTPEVITLDNGQSQAIRLNVVPGTSLTVPFTANRLGEYGVSIAVRDPGVMLTQQQAEWLISNRFDQGMIRQLVSGF